MRQMLAAELQPAFHRRGSRRSFQYDGFHHSLHRMPRALPGPEARVARPAGRMALSGTRIGGGSGCRTEIRRDERSPAVAVHQHRIGFCTGLAVDDHHTGPFGSEMLVAPGEQRPQHRPKIASGFGQHVFVARRSFAIAAAFEQTRFDQGLEPPRQDVGRNPQALLKLVEPRQAERRIAQNEDAPPLADPLQAAGDRALHVAEALAPHGFAPQLTCMLQAIWGPAIIMQVNFAS